jgi:transporter family-2 protein
LLFMALLLAGQLFVALLLDHFGWAGFRQSSISLGKVSGLLLIFGGVWLIQRG